MNVTTKIYVCFENMNMPEDYYEDVIAVFDSDQKAKDFVTKMDKACGSEYVYYSYQVLNLNDVERFEKEITHG